MNKSQTIERKAGREKRLFLEENDGSSLNSFRAQSSAELSTLEEFQVLLGQPRHWPEFENREEPGTRDWSWTLVLSQATQACYERSAYNNLLLFAYLMTSAKYKSLYEKCNKYAWIVINAK